MPKLVPSHLEPTASDRGFAALPALAGAYGGEIEVYESSAASGPHLWVKATDETGKEVILHLSAETSWKFAEQVVTAVRNHYQGDSTPESAAYVVIDRDAMEPERCPHCDSPAPNLHPAMQSEGEVQPCPDSWHGGTKQS